MGLFSKKNKPTEEERNDIDKIRTDRAIKRLPMMYFFTILFGIAFAVLVSSIIQTPEHDLFNGTTLVLPSVMVLLLHLLCHLQEIPGNLDSHHHLS